MHPNIWYPFTVQKGASEPFKVVSGKGLWLRLEDGRKLADCISSWWVNLHGHAHPEIADAIHKQAQQLEHVLFANFTHEPAERLAEKIAGMLPGKLNRVFYSDNGSTAVEVALKMAVQYWKNKGEARTRFLAFEGAYHGDTFGAMSAGARSVFNRAFNEMLFDVDFVDFPATWEGDENAEETEDRVIGQIKELFRQHPGQYAGIILEPLVQGAGGMRMCRDGFLEKLSRETRKFGSLMIFDEVMTGFGRTGETFACERAGAEPDIICLAKGITGGFLPLSVTVCNEEVYSSFYSDDPLKTFWHGHSYTANPLGCAAGLASMNLLEDNETGKSFRGMEQKHKHYLSDILETGNVEKARVKGTIAAFDVITGEETGYLNDISGQIKEKCVDYGLLIRPLGNTVYLMPPYCITDDELSGVYGRLKELLSTIG